MNENEALHLCGGIIFDLFLETRKPRKKMRNRQMLGTDNLSDVDIFKGLVYIVTGESMDGYSGGSIRKCVSMYKCCENSKSSYVPFTDSVVRNAFVSYMEQDKELIYNRLLDFKNKYLNEGKCEWLIRAIIETIQNDYSIEKGTMFEVMNDTWISKENLNEIQNFSFTVFIGSVLKYVIEKCPDCESGKETFLKWYTRNSERSEWKFNSNIGDSLQPIKVVFEAKPINGEITTANNETTNEQAEILLEINEKQIDDEKTLNDAQRFCLKHEKEMGLLPLCQIAYNVDSLHKDVRKMYLDYKLCDYKTRRKIMELKNIPILDFSNKNWLEECIDKYNKQIHKDGLTTKEFLYDGAKYLHRAYERNSKCLVLDFEPQIFRRPFKGEKKYILKENNLVSLSLYIQDYYWSKKENPKYYVEPPMDYLWRSQKLGGCPEVNMTYWVCEFIIASSYHMVCDGFPLDEKWQNVNISHELIQTQEDMYYYALFQLYWLYMLERIQ